MNNCTMYEQQHNTIAGRGAWHYLIDTPIGALHVVEWEEKSKEITRRIIDNDNEKAEKLFARICCKMLKDV